MTSKPPSDSSDELLVHISYIKQGIDAINEKLEAQNGRVRTAETDIAILKDRQSDARKSGTTWGAGGGFVGGLVAGFLQSWMTGK